MSRLMSALSGVTYVLNSDTLGGTICNLFGLRERQSVREGRRCQPDTHDPGRATVIRS